MTPTDEQLLAALGRRDPGALEALYDRHHRLALALALRILGEPQAAEDVVQEVFLAIWQAASKFDPSRGSVRTWLLAMVHHRAIDHLRKASPARQTVELTETTEDRGAAPVWQQALEQVRGEQIAQALASLSPVQRETIELAYFGGRSQSEIAELQEVPLGTVKGRTRLALEKLRGLLVGLREEPA